MKTKITHDEYLKFLGLCALMAEHDKATSQIERASEKLLGLPEDDCGHAYDALHGSRKPREALDLLGIEIEKGDEEV